METPREDRETELFDLVRNLGPPPVESRDTLSGNLVITETRLTSLRRQHDELIKEMDRCHFTINAINSLYSPWRRLPAELLAEVFSYCRPDKPTQRPSIRNVPLTLTQVCSTWYRIASAIPHLWSSIVLTSDHPYISGRLAHGTEYFRTCALRSNGDPIELHLNIHFIAYRPSYELIKRYSHQISTISFHYPQILGAQAGDRLPEGPCTWFIHSDSLIMPNLCSLEVQDPNLTDNLSEADFSQLRIIADSAQSLRRYMFHGRLVQPDGPVLTNWSNVTELTLIDPTPVALLSYILRNAPLLRMASFNCLYESLAPNISLSMRTMLSHPELTVPFTHDHLQTLLVSYGDSVTLVSLFSLVTLPKLEHILIEKWNEDANAWAQEAFVSFLLRSQCRLKALDLYFTPITTEGLLEILEVPMVMVALRELMIQNGHSDSEKIINDDFCELLTLPTRLDGNNDQSGGTPRVICPNLEIIGFHSCHSCSKPTLVRMLRSRLDPNFQYHQPSALSPPLATPQGFTYLKYFETDVPPEVAQQYFKPLLQDGLVTLPYDSSTNMLPPTEEESKMLRRFTSEGLELWEYDPVQGAWGPTDFWMKV